MSATRVVTMEVEYAILLSKMAGARAESVEIRFGRAIPERDPFVFTELCKITAILGLPTSFPEIPCHFDDAVEIHIHAGDRRWCRLVPSPILAVGMR